MPRSPSPRLGLESLSGGDFGNQIDDVMGDYTDLLDSKTVAFGQGPIALRPTSTAEIEGIGGLLWWATDDEVLSYDFGAGWVDLAPVDALSVVTGMIADGAITTAKLADDAVTTAKIAAEAVTTEEIKDGTIATGDLANGAVTLAKREILQACRCTLASGPIVGDATPHAFAFTSEVYDTATIHSTSSNTSRFVAPVTGLYSFEGHARLDEPHPASTWSSTLIVTKNAGGTQIAYHTVVGDGGDTADFSHTVGDHVALAAGDYLELKLQQGLANPATIFDIRFAMALLGRLA